ncbi:hypothetical protein IFR04_010670 [Cadophora malorum]|uniref:Uncharacterized protein n=1 Tax=Cadophora malorum TaxID=108018 RepID=A0A8H7TCB6_9HELO|nr:hypothetical protein IFR04_010670 [Cadophora malorum]
MKQEEVRLSSNPDLVLIKADLFSDLLSQLTDTARLGGSPGLRSALLSCPDGRCQSSPSLKLTPKRELELSLIGDAVKLYR